MSDFKGEFEGEYKCVHVWARVRALILHRPHLISGVQQLAALSSMSDPSTDCLFSSVLFFRCPSADTSRFVISADGSA